MEKFWAFLKYYKNGHKLDVDAKLNSYLDKFKTIDDFRVEEPQINEMLEGVGSLPVRHRSMSDSEGTVEVGSSTKETTRDINRQRSV